MSRQETAHETGCFHIPVHPIRFPRMAFAVDSYCRNNYCLGSYQVDRVPQTAQGKVNRAQIEGLLNQVREGATSIPDAME